MVKNSLDWLLEEDQDNPGVRYFALRDLVGLPEDDPQVVDAQEAVMKCGPVPVILANQHPDGWWDRPGSGYYPKYTGTVWSLTFLAQLGAKGDDPRVRASCEHVLTHHRSPYGGLSIDNKKSGLIHCLQGNLCAALVDFGLIDDERTQAALDWLARSVTGEGIAPAEEKDAEVRYYRSGNSARGFCCSANDHKPCAWGAVKAMLALGKVPQDHRTPAVEAAIQAGVDFLFSCDPATADYPMGYNTKPSRSWFQFGYPVFYITDVLQNLEVLTALGYSSDPRIDAALELVRCKQDAHGRWVMEYTYNGKTWVDIEVKKQASKWVTLRALRVLMPHL